MEKTARKKRIEEPLFFIDESGYFIAGDEIIKPQYFFQIYQPGLAK